MDDSINITIREGWGWLVVGVMIGLTISTLFHTWMDSKF